MLLINSQKNNQNFVCKTSEIKYKISGQGKYHKIQESIIKAY